ncbi:uncharacterized protein [Dysidea avara]|uniref:uncharacterized protein n=1 Tax=Dysidea avara TaxID=196820 RepID=UPI00332FA3EC
MAISYFLVAVLVTIVVTINPVVGVDVDYNEYGLCTKLPGKSCGDIYQLNPTSRGKSGYYIVQVGDRPMFVHCDMELEYGGEKGWMRVANIDLSKGDDCPHGWSKITSPVAACRAPSDNAGCYSAQFSTHQVPYSRVCGMVIGYQKSTPDAFADFLHMSRSIDGPYVDGVSITYGTPRKHIWTYAIGQSELFYDANKPYNCPCTKYPGRLPPAFVHENYYCESASLHYPGGYQYFTSDPVWDGEGCSNENSCCSEPNLPWFYRQIPLTSDKNIEARICCDEHYSNEGVLVKEIKLYVQ